MKKFKHIAVVIATTSFLTMPMFAHAGNSNDCENSGFHQHFKMDDGLGQGERKHDFKGPGRIPFKLLDLSDTQKQTLEASRSARAPAMKEAHEKLRAARQALDKAGDENADDATLNKLADDLANIIAQQEVSRIKIHREFLNILTPEQQEKLAAFEAEHKGQARWKHREKDRQKNTSSTNATKS
ncbi:MAG: hypothetical protein EOO52_11720 [Gammaproteobacteria bacterium]|nr:MAG: hypothetical protein EOO52_11720 [Gammaproteobacteria bacterium]